MIHKFVVTVKGCTQDRETVGAKIRNILSECSETNVIVEVDDGTDSIRVITREELLK